MRLSTRLLLCCGAVLPSLLTPAAGTSIPASAIVKSLGIAETSQNQPRYNMQQVVTREKGVITSQSLWILVNAYYDADGCFYRNDPTKIAFGIQTLASGTVPGEEKIDPRDQSYIVWHAQPNAGKAIIGDRVNGVWKTYNLQYGWEMGFLCSANGNCVVGGFATEYDGNGTFPFGRVGNISAPATMGFALDIAGVERTNHLVTVTTQTPHHLQANDCIDISGVAMTKKSYINGRFYVKAVTPTTFTIEQKGENDTGAGGKVLHRHHVHGLWTNLYADWSDRDRRESSAWVAGFEDDCFVVKRLPENAANTYENLKELFSIDKNGVFRVNGSTPVADGTYTMGPSLTPKGHPGTITITNGIITAVQQAD